MMLRPLMAMMLITTCSPAVAAEPVSFRRDIAPLLQRRCQACHGPKKAKGDYRVDTFTRLVKPGQSTLEAVTPGKPDDSELYVLLASDDPDERMPHEADALPHEQVELVKRWIVEGARYDAEDRDAPIASIVPARVHPEPPEVYPMPLPITAMAFSPDGETLAVSGYHEVTLWSTSTGELKRRIKGVAQRTFALMFSDDGKTIAVGGGTPGEFGEARIIDVTTGEAQRVMGPFEDVVFDVALAADGATLAVAGADHLIRLFDTETGSQRIVIDVHSDWVTAIDFDRSGKRLASSSRDKSAKVLDATSGTILASYSGHGDPVYGVAIAADGKHVISAEADGRVHVWKIDDAKKVREIKGTSRQMYKLTTHDQNVFVYTPNGRVRRHTDGKESATRTYEGHDATVFSVAVDRAGKRIAAGARDGRVIIWLVKDAKRVATFIAMPGRPE